jgi:hypothetical protein
MIDNRAIMGYAKAAAIIIGLYLLFLVVRWFLRSRIMSKDTEDSGSVFSLSELSQMLDKGLISQQEHDQLKKAMLGDATKSVDRKGK